MNYSCYPFLSGALLLWLEYKIVFTKIQYDHLQLYMDIDICRAIDKREYLVIIRDNFCQFYIKTYVVTPHLNRLFKTVQMRGHIIWFR